VNEDCLKLTAYFGERQRTEDQFLADALLDLFGDREIATSILLRGITGFGLRHHLRTDQMLSLSEDPRSPRSPSMPGTRSTPCSPRSWKSNAVAC